MTILAFLLSWMSWTFDASILKDAPVDPAAQTQQEVGVFQSSSEPMTTASPKARPVA